MNKNAVQCIILFFGFRFLFIDFGVPVLLVLFGGLLPGMDIARGFLWNLGFIWIICSRPLEDKAEALFPVLIQWMIGFGAIAAVVVLSALSALHIMRTS